MSVKSKFLKIHYYLLFILALFLLVLLVQACDKRTRNTWQGYLEAEYIYVASPFYGYLNKLFVARGDVVKSNSLLFELDLSEEEISITGLNAQIQQAEAYLADAKEGERQEELELRKARIAQSEARNDFSHYEFERRKDLVHQKAISESDFERYRTQSRIDEASLYESKMALVVAQLGKRSNQIEALAAAVKQAQAQKERILWQKEQKVKRAPLDAIVFDIFFRPGELVPQGRPVVSLLSAEYLKVRFFVKSDEVVKLKQGLPLKCFIGEKGLKKSFDAKIIYISPRPEFTPTMIYSRECREKLVFMVEAKPDFPDTLALHPGQPVEVALIE